MNSPCIETVTFLVSSQMWRWIPVVLFAVSVGAQLFTCDDQVTLCVETCCCVPLQLCTCCGLEQLCTDGECAAPIPSPSISISATAAPSISTSSTAAPSISSSATPSISSSSPPAASCIQLDADAITCTGPLNTPRVVLPANVSTVLGDLEIGGGTVLVVAAPILVKSGVAVVDGAVEVTGGLPPTVRDGQFVPVLTVDQDGQLLVASNASVRIASLPDAERACADVRQRSTEQRGASLGVVFSVDDSGCTDDSNTRWIYTTLVPVIGASCAVITCACAVCLTVIVSMVFWRRVRGALWARESDHDTDRVVNR